MENGWPMFPGLGSPLFNPAMRSVPRLPDSYASRNKFWRFAPSVISLNPNAPSVALQSLAGNLNSLKCVLCTVVADLTNSVPVALGSRELVIPAGSSIVNNCFGQLDAGRMCCIYVDDPDTEYFDLATIWATHADAAVTQVLYISDWRFNLQ